MVDGPRPPPTPDVQRIYSRNRVIGGALHDMHESAQENVERYRQSYKAQAIPFIQGMGDPDDSWREVWTNSAGEEEEVLVKRNKRGRFVRRPVAPKPWRVT